ncbi:MAG: hypothetical protein JNK65_04940, partial [Deltaproteobacteria bacterium]|nr:hypothetical protein [Deltaproteobacteria bacterium]
MSTKRSKHFFLDSIRYHQWAPDPLGSSKPPVPLAPPNGDGLNGSKPEPRTPPNTPPTSNSSSQNRGDALSGFQSGQFNPSNSANPNPTQNRTRPAAPSGRSLPQQDNDSSHLSDRPLERSSQIFHEHAPQRIYANEGREVVVLRNQATVEPQIQNAPVASETIGLMNTNHVIESLMLHLQPMLSNTTSMM